MKFFKFGLFCGLLFTQCFGMESLCDGAEITALQNPNPEITKILNTLKTKHSEQTLHPEEFWTLMAAHTGMASCFLGECIANSEENDLCLVFGYLIKFGQENKNKFYECMTGCLGIDGTTPLNELIRRMPNTPVDGSRIVQIFFQLLNLIKTLEKQQLIHILNQIDFYGTHPMQNALSLNKLYIHNAIAGIFAPPWALDKFIFVATSSEAGDHIYTWDGEHLNSVYSPQQ
jgi:hypothetical protein